MPFVTTCYRQSMSQKQPKPTLTGQKIRTRKREDKARKHDPHSFRNELTAGLQSCSWKFDEILKFLENAGHRLEYNKYGETLFEVLIAGNIIAPGGQIEEESRWDGCVFECGNEELLRGFNDVFEKLMRRYKYLLKVFQNHTSHMIKFINIWPEEYTCNFATLFGLMFVSSAIITPKVLDSLLADYLVRNECALRFVTAAFEVWLANTDFDTFSAAMKKSGTDDHLLEFFPENKRKAECLEEHFKGAGLDAVIRFFKDRTQSEIVNGLRARLTEMLEAKEPADRIAEVILAVNREAQLPEAHLITLLWPCVMNSVEWSMKADMIERQVAQHMSVHAPLLSRFTRTGRAQLNALNTIQSYCYENMTFLKYLRSVVFSLYHNDVLEEEAIQKWYKDAHTSKGWSIFQEQMLTMIRWLECAEEDSS